MALSARPFLRELSLRPDLSLDFDSYPFNIPAVANLGTLTLHLAVTFLVGENGAGKSTILEAIAVAMGLPAEGGSRNVLRLQQAASPLQDALRLNKGYQKPRWSYFLRAESAFSVISYMDNVHHLTKDSLPRPDAAPPGQSLHRRSHGEAFMDILLKLGRDGFYLLDEPEAALSPNRQLAALSVIDNLVKGGSQFIIATHSPILLAYPNAKILVCDASGITETAYEDTEHYAVTRDFLNHYPRRLQQLLGDGEEAEDDA